MSAHPEISCEVLNKEMYRVTISFIIYTVHLLL